ncbi:hypothetical protein ACHAW6_007623, partial [Cyclotella cf. meneghiniana]
MHKCNVKSTNCSHHSDTVRFHHKHITNPTITPADKLMSALVNCKQALLRFTSNEHNAELQQLEQLLDTTNQHIQSNMPSNKPIPRVLLPSQVPKVSQHHPRVQTTGTTTSSQPAALIQLPKSTHSITRSAICCKRSIAQPDFTSPAMNTRSCTAAKQTAPTTQLSQPKPSQASKLNQHTGSSSAKTKGLWTHKWQPITFTRVVDDFGVKYLGQEHALHLKSILKEHYTVSMDWTWTRYIGLSLDWDYTQLRVHLSMPGYVSQALKKFQHHKPSSPQYQPFS